MVLITCRLLYTELKRFMSTNAGPIVLILSSRLSFKCHLVLIYFYIQYYSFTMINICTYITGRDPRDLHEDRDGRLQDSHGRNHKVCIGYDSNADTLHGMSNSNSHTVVNIVSLQYMTLSDGCVGNEAEGEYLKECGRPFGNQHTICTPIVEATLVPTRDNRNKCSQTIEEMIHTDLNVAHQMEVTVDNTEDASPQNQTDNEGILIVDNKML